MNTEYHKVASHEIDPHPGDRVLLLYSGGLDTSIMLKWLQDKYKVDVYAVCVNIGQCTEKEFQPIIEKALNLGAKKCDIIDMRARFARDICMPAIKANADYEDGYRLFCPLGRVAISEAAVEYAHKHNIKIICHGATGKGNDQIRFENYITTLDPSLKILAPVREWSMGRDEEIEYAKKHNIPIEQSLDKIYSYDENLWGCSAEGGEIEDLSAIPKLDRILKKTLLPEKAYRDKPAYVKIEFKNGNFIDFQNAKRDGILKTLSDLILMVGHYGYLNGIGITHLIEDRVIGLKVRGVYEEPAAEILIQAHKALEKIVSTREEYSFKRQVDQRWGEMVYEGRWYHPLMNHLNSYIESVQKKVTGIVTMRLFKGRAEAVAVESPNSLYDADSATFLKDSQFNQNSSAGFIEHFNYSQKIAYNKTKHLYDAQQKNMGKKVK